MDDDQIREEIAFQYEIFLMQEGAHQRFDDFAEHLIRELGERGWRIERDATEHVIEFREDGWTIKHPLACRPNLFDCPVSRAAERTLAEPPDARGRFTCTVTDGGELRILHPIVAEEVPGA